MTEDGRGGELQRLHVVVRGRVQGVAYRWFTQERARRAGVAGWVRNRGDGSVEAVLEGAAAAIDALLAELQQGPPAARVEQLEREPERPLGERGFEIR